jgi:hypothetical protein
MHSMPETIHCSLFPFSVLFDCGITFDAHPTFTAPSTGQCKEWTLIAMFWKTSLLAASCMFAWLQRAADQS